LILISIPIWSHRDNVDDLMISLLERSNLGRVVEEEWLSARIPEVTEDRIFQRNALSSLIDHRTVEIDPNFLSNCRSMIHFLSSPNDDLSIPLPIGWKLDRPSTGPRTPFFDDDWEIASTIHRVGHHIAKCQFDTTY